MSVEEEVELRDLVAQTLELNGCLPKIRAQLRANLFLALDEDSKVSKQRPLLNKKVKSYLEVPEGQLMFSLVREFLEYFNLDFTASVYEPESYVGSYYKYEGRQKIIEDLGMKDTGDDPGPILLYLVKIAQTQTKSLKINLNLNEDEVKESNDSSTVSLAHGKSASENGDFTKFNSHNSHDDPKKSLSTTHNTNLNSYANEVKENGHILENFDTTYVKKDGDNDDTFNSTSSIEEEIVNGNESKTAANKKLATNEEGSTSSEVGSSPETKSSLVKSMKNEKLKPKLELPPLQLNKSRDLLPSLYQKDFKDKPNKDYDFEIKDDYEEDFMSGSEIDFSHSKNDSSKPSFEELQRRSDYTTKANVQTDQEPNSKLDNKTVQSDSTDIQTNLSVDDGILSNSKLLSSEINII